MRWMHASLVAGALVLGGCNAGGSLSICERDEEDVVTCNDPVLPPAPETVEPEADS
jgi:hypothetical protein